VRARALAVACVLMMGCGQGGRPTTTVGAQIGNLSAICMTERTHHDGELGWAYGVCIDPDCVRFHWVYSDDVGMYLGESQPAYADNRCQPPSRSHFGPISVEDRIGGRRICTTEQVSYSGGTATAYAVCVDAACSEMVWIYGDADVFLGESQPLPPGPCSP
jgi:hypothetical protein